MKAKKILAGACASLMLATVAVPTVSAADAVTVTIGNAEAKAGEKFSVSVDLADIPSGGINAIEFGITYDSTALSVTSVKAGELAVNDTSLADVDTLIANTSEAGMVSVMWGNNSSAITSEGTFVTIEGTVSDSAAAGKYDLKMAVIDRDGNEEYVFGYHTGEATDAGVYYTPTVTDGYVTVTGETETTEPTTDAPTTPSVSIGEASCLGNVDLDEMNEINIADLTTLGKYLLNSSIFNLSPEALANADVTKDGTVTSSDSSKLAEYVLEKITAF